MSPVKVFLTFTICLAAFVPSARAGEIDTCSAMKAAMKPDRQYGYLSVGTTWFANDDLNAKLKSSAYSSFKSNALTFSISDHKEYKRLIFESPLSLHFWKDNVDSGIRTSLFSSDLLWNTGFNVLPSNLPAILFPELGLGLGFNLMRIRSDSKTLATILTTTEPNSLLWQGSFLFNVGIGSDLIVAAADRNAGLTIGIRAGYTLDIYTAKHWYSDGVTISDVPSLPHNGPYVRVILGGWGEKKPMKCDMKPST